MTNEEIIRGAYAAGKRRITCPACLGGESLEEDTMSIWRGDDGTVRGSCYRATCNAFLASGWVGGSTQSAPFEPRPLLSPYRRATVNDYWGKEWCRRLELCDFFGSLEINKAAERGLRVLTALPDVAVWRLRALNGDLVGHITRTLDKKISTYKDLDRPLYYWNHVPRTNANSALFVFEDPLSAALCDQVSVALLGTTMSAGLVEDIKKFAFADFVLVCLDPGAEDAALKVYNKLVAAGVPAVFVPMAKDYKDMTPAERKELEETYA